MNGYKLTVAEMLYIDEETDNLTNYHLDANCPRSHIRNTLSSVFAKDRMELEAVADSAKAEADALSAENMHLRAELTALKADNVKAITRLVGACGDKLVQEEEEGHVLLEKGEALPVSGHVNNVLEAAMLFPTFAPDVHTRRAALKARMDTIRALGGQIEALKGKLEAVTQEQDAAMSQIQQAINACKVALKQRDDMKALLEITGSVCDALQEHIDCVTIENVPKTEGDK